MGAGAHNQEGQRTSGVQMRGGGMYSSGGMGGVRTTGEQQQMVCSGGYYSNSSSNFLHALRYVALQPNRGQRPAARCDRTGCRTDSEQQRHYHRMHRDNRAGLVLGTGARSQIVDETGINALEAGGLAVGNVLTDVAERSRLGRETADGSIDRIEQGHYFNAPELRATISTNHANE